MLTWYWVWLSIFSKKRQIDRSFDEKVYYKFIDHRVKVLENLTLTLNVIGFHLLYSANRMQYCDWNLESIWTTISQHWLESKLSDKGISCTCFELFCENNSNEVSLNSSYQMIVTNVNNCKNYFLNQTQVQSEFEICKKYYNNWKVNSENKTVKHHFCLHTATIWYSSVSSIFLH